MKNWLKIGIGVKRWLVTVVFASGLLGIGIAGMAALLVSQSFGPASNFIAPLIPLWVLWLIFILLGVAIGSFAILSLVSAVLAPFSRLDGHLADELLKHRQQRVGPKVVAIGGGTGLSNLLRGLVPYTSNITAIVTVADDGGSSGRLRREYGMLPPGDFRNNIAALSDDEALMTQLLQYRFGGNGKDQGLSGHAFGNLLITALVGLTGSFEDALLATRRVLSIRGQVFPSTLTPVNLIADVEVEGRLKKIYGESAISHENGIIRKIDIEPATARAYPAAIQAILAADLVILGPGSLFTSIVPNLLIRDIAKAIESSLGRVVYVCNVSSQKGETENFSVSDHINKIGDYLPLHRIDHVIANNNYDIQPEENDWQPILVDHSADVAIHQADIIDANDPWQHDSSKLALVLFNLLS